MDLVLDMSGIRNFVNNLSDTLSVNFFLKTAVAYTSFVTLRPHHDHTINTHNHTIDKKEVIR